MPVLSILPQYVLGERMKLKASRLSIIRIAPKAIQIRVIRG